MICGNLYEKLGNLVISRTLLDHLCAMMNYYSNDFRFYLENFFTKVFKVKYEAQHGEFPTHFGQRFPETVTRRSNCSIGSTIGLSRKFCISFLTNQ